jgi:hypothetical protein
LVRIKYKTHFKNHNGIAVFLPGMTDITAFRIEGTFVPGVKETAVPKASGIVNEFAFKWLAK